jgi:hypothetical protein
LGLHFCDTISHFSDFSLELLNQFLAILFLFIVDLSNFGLFALELRSLGLLLIQAELQISQFDVVLFLEGFHGGLQAIHLICLQGE